MRTLIDIAKNNTWQKVSYIYNTFVPCMNDPFMFGGLFYCIVQYKRHGMEMVMLFNMKKEAWEYPNLLDEQCFNPLCLVEFEKQLFLICESKVYGVTLQVWKLDSICAMLLGLRKLRCYLFHGMGVLFFTIYSWVRNSYTWDSHTTSRLVQ